MDLAGAGGTAGGGLAFLSEASSSPSVQAMKQRIMARFPSATWHEYEAINNDNAVQGAAMAFGGAGGGGYRMMYDFAAAKTVVSLDADFLGAGTPASLKWTRDFAASRVCDRSGETWAEPARLYAIEGIVSLTGANADHRIAVRSSDVAKIAAWIASQVGVANVPAALANLDAAALGAKVGAGADADKTLHALVEDLKNHGPSIVIVGERQPAEVHLLGHLINRALGNLGRTITAARVEGVEGHLASLGALADKINSNAVQTLVIIGGNPAYNAPADIDFASLIRKVQTCIHLSDYNDETSRACAGGGAAGWHINRAHFLEAWGDVRAADGTWSITQPLIMPIFEGKTPAELLAVIANEPVTTSYEITRAVFAANVGGATPTPRGARRCTTASCRTQASLRVQRRKRWAPIMPPRSQRLSSAWRAARQRTRLKSPSRLMPASTTAVSPTTAGCRNCLIRSPNSRGTTRSCSAPAALALSA